MAVPALTRVTLESLSTSDSKDTVSLYVNTGAVRSKVTHTENKKIDYTARTAVAVASVRGTDFTITARGKVSCREGAVAVYSAKNYVPPQETEESTGEEEEPEESGDDSGEDSGSDNGSETAEASETESQETGSEGTGTEVADSGSEGAATSEASSSQDTGSAADTGSSSDKVAASDKGSSSDKGTSTDKGTTTDKTTSNEKTTTESGGSKKETGSATAATPAREISSSATDGAVVVGAGQSTSFTTTGNPNKPTTDTAGKTDKVKNQVNTQAQKDATASGGTKTETVPVETPKPTKGTVVVSITLEG